MLAIGPKVLAKMELLSPSSSETASVYPTRTVHIQGGTRITSTFTPHSKTVGT
jgi:hypothetical protein